MTTPTLKELAILITQQNHPISFSMLEIGGRPIGDSQEPFYALLDAFPGSQIFGFEVDLKTCDELNANSKPGVTFFPSALGAKEEYRVFYEANHPMCGSLFQPNDEFNRLYNNLEVAFLKSTSSIETVSLDYFSMKNKIGDIDFIKIDIQGAELDVFRGGIETLEEVLMVVSEVMFVPHYINTPLFGDVSSFLSSRGLMYHKFLGTGGRALTPIILGNDVNVPSQHIWSDAVFIRHVLSIPKLSPEKLLKLGVLSLIYNSPDLTYYCLKHFDNLQGSKLHEDFIKLIGN